MSMAGAPRAAELSVNGANANGGLGLESAAAIHQEAMRQLEQQAISLDSPHGSTDGKRIQTQGLPPASRQCGSSGRIVAPVEEQSGMAGGFLFQSMRQWSYNAYKCTKQLVSERLGRATRTADLETDVAVAGLRESRRRYEALLNLAVGLTKHFQAVCDTQRVLSESCLEMARFEPADCQLADEFVRTGESQRALQKSGEKLLVALQAFCAALSVLVTRTFEDALRTIGAYEHARIEFDAYRGDLDTLSVNPAGPGGRNGATFARAEELKQRYEARRQRYERLKEDVRIKIKFLEENKVRVMQKQLHMFQSAVSAYFTGNQEALDAVLKQINRK